MVSYCNLCLASSVSESAFTLIFTCGRNSLHSFSSILLKFVLHVVNDQFSDGFNNYFYLVSVITSKVVSCILLEFVLHVARNQFLDKFNWLDIVESGLV